MEGLSHAREELERLWDRARRTGDRALKQAVGHAALERGIAGIRDEYLASDKDAAMHFQKYTVARIRQDDWKSGTNRSLSAMAGYTSLAKPPELYGSPEIHAG